MLNQQQETINTFIKSLEEKISQNSQQPTEIVRTGLQYPAIIHFGAGGGFNRENKAKCLQVVSAGELTRESTEIVEEQHCRLEEVRLNLTTPLTSEGEASEPETYGGARPKTTSRANLTSVAPNTLPHEAVAQTYSHHSKVRWEHPLEDCAVLLRDEVFNVIPGTVNTQHGTAYHNRKVKSSSGFSNIEVFHPPRVPDMSIAGSSHGHKVTFRSLVVRLMSVSSTTHLVP